MHTYSFMIANYRQTAEVLANDVNAATDHYGSHVTCGYPLSASRRAPCPRLAGEKFSGQTWLLFSVPERRFFVAGSSIPSLSTARKKPLLFLLSLCIHRVACLFYLSLFSPLLWFSVIEYISQRRNGCLFPCPCPGRQGRRPGRETQRLPALLSIRLRWCRLLLRHPRCLDPYRCVSGFLLHFTLHSKQATAAGRRSARNHIPCAAH